jgi:hypothetical protein
VTTRKDKQGGKRLFFKASGNESAQDDDAMGGGELVTETT